MTDSSRTQRTPVIIATTALVVALAGATGPVTAAVFDAVNADKVDGKHAVGAKASPAKRKGKLVATNTAGRLPNNILAKALDANKLDGIDSTGFLRKDAQAADADTLDGIDSTGFLGKDAQAADADTLDGIDSTGFLGKEEQAADADTVDGRHADQLAVRALFASGAGTAPTTATTFLATPALVAVTQGQQVHVTSHKAFGSTAAAGASGLNLLICHRPSTSTTTPTSVGAGVFGNRVTQNTRVTMGLSAVISNLPTGNHHVGLCGSSSDAANWNFNEFSYTSALVTSPPAQAAAARSADQSKPRP